MKAWGIPALILTGGLAMAQPVPNEPNFVQQLVRRSVATMDRNWKEAPEYVFRERDIQSDGGKKSVKTQRVWMIGGSPYYELTGINGEPLNAKQRQAEQKKLEHEVKKRRSESPYASNERVAQYLKERHQDQALMREMTNAFVFKMVGEEKLNGHDVYVLDASPKPGYTPPSMETRVLTGMRGRLWIDRKDAQWVKVEAEVFQPVKFGLFIAKVQPGTRFELEQEPVKPDIWLPSHFRMSVNASILWWQKNSLDDETYSDYQPKDALSARLNSGR
jgi:hypothetical protein